MSYIVWACSGNFTLFVASRILGGLSKGNTTICTAVVTDITTPKTRAKGMVRIINDQLLFYLLTDTPQALSYMHKILCNSCYLKCIYGQNFFRMLRRVFLKNISIPSYFRHKIVL